MQGPRRAGRRPAALLGIAATIGLMLAPTPVARGHFLWLTADRDGRSTGVEILAFLSEVPAPDLPQLMRSIESARYEVDGRPVEADRGEDTFVIRPAGPSPRVVDGACDLGLMSRDGETFRIAYTARVQFGPSPGADIDGDSDRLRLRLVRPEGGPPEVLVTFDGQPAAGASVKAHLDDGAERDLTADDSGRVDCPEVADGRAALLARWGDGTPGELDGKPFDQTRHYATLTVAREAPADAAATTTVDDGRDDAPIALLSEPLNSFGGAVLGDHLYVYSGHTGTTHRYHTGTTNPHFRRIALTGGASWEDLPCGPAVQGVALVTDGEMLYRVGGMMARNAEGEPHDLASVADVARFDPEAGTWTDLPPLPEPRSTHDAAVLGRHLYVVGGWTMPGGDSGDASWCDDALRLDLDRPEAGWEELPTPPFQRRALAVAASDGKIVAIGGLTEDGSVVRSVAVFDPEAGSWSTGPDLPGDRVQGFAPSAFEVDGRLLASGGNGTVYRLSESGDAWEAIARQAVPRITHRLLPGPDGVALIVGGNHAGVPVRFVESIPTDGPADAPRAVSWSAPVVGSALQSQAVGLVGPRLLVAGGNRSDAPHDFAPENLESAAYRFALDGGGPETIAPLPEPRQSAAIVAVPSGPRGATAYLIGGIGHDGEVVRTLGDVSRLDPSGDGWTKLDAGLPDDRGLFGAVEHDGAIWVFGGSVWDPRSGREARSMPSSVLRWDPGSEGSTFEATGHELPTPRRSFAGAAIGGKYYLVGGLGADMTIVDRVDVFDFATGNWSTAPAPEHPRLFADLAALGGKLYLAGGFVKGSSGHFEPARSVEVFDPESGSWAVAMEEAPVPGPNLRLLATRDRLLLLGTGGEADAPARLAIVAP